MSAAEPADLLPPEGFAFTDEVHRLLAAAYAAAQRRGHNWVGTEHVVLALAQQPEVWPVLARLGVDAARVAGDVLGVFPPDGDGAPPLGGRRMYTDRTRHAAILAARSAHGFGRSRIGAEDLVVGLLREGGSVGAQVLMRCGLALETALARTRRLAAAAE
jgi:ATP-dependent Clp protease ATP-binding subunit ClpC